MVVINKKVFRKCLEENEKVFKEILGNKFSSPEEFLTCVEKEKKLDVFIEENECLLGIILGYGFESPKLFVEKNFGLKNDEYPEWTDHYSGIDIQGPKRCLIFPIGFMCDPTTEEAKKLQTVYQQELKELWIKYKRSRNTLQLVLERLCSTI